MAETKKNESIRVLVETALLIAMALILGEVKLFKMPLGGSVHPAAMLPLVLIGLRHGPKWGFVGYFAYSLLHMVIGGLEGLTLWSVLLDYVLAYTFIGLTGLFKGKKNGLWYAMPVAAAVRFVFSYIAGVTIWAEYTPEGWNPWIYSLAYQMAYLLPELALMFLVAFAMRLAWPRILDTEVK